MSKPWLSYTIFQSMKYYHSNLEVLSIFHPVSGSSVINKANIFTTNVGATHMSSLSLKEEGNKYSCQYL